MDPQLHAKDQKKPESVLIKVCHGQTDKTDFIGPNPTKVRGPKKDIK